MRSILIIFLLITKLSFAQDSSAISKVHNRLLNYWPKKLFTIKEATDSTKTKTYFGFSKKDSSLFRIRQREKDTIYEYYLIGKELVLIMVIFTPSQKKKPLVWWYYFDNDQLVGIRHPTAPKTEDYRLLLKKRYEALIAKGNRIKFNCYCLGSCRHEPYTSSPRAHF